MAQKKPSERVEEIIRKRAGEIFATLDAPIRETYTTQALQDPAFVLQAILQHLDEVHESSAKENRQP